MPAVPASTGLFDALTRSAEEPGQLVLTPTSQSAATLRSRYDDRQRAACEEAGNGHRSWKPARVLAWQQWLASLWSSLVLHGYEERTLLNTAQEDLLWRDVIAPSLAPANLPGASTVAGLARSALARAEAYRLPMRRLAEEADTEDARAFAVWAAQFARLCSRHQRVPAAGLARELLRYVARCSLQLPGEIFLCGFAEVPPADDLLLSALLEAGTRVTHIPVDLPAEPTTRTLLRAANEAEELRAIAHWLRSFLEARVAVGERPSVAVVFADPRTDAGAVDTIFREVLAPELDSISADPASAPWQRGVGQPLRAVPLIGTMLRLLRGMTQPLPLDEVTALLLSPHLGSSPVGAGMGPQSVRELASERRSEAAQLDAYTVRQAKLLRPELTFVELQQLAQSSPYGASTLGWLRPLLALVARQDDLSGTRTWADWSATIRSLATAAGWPGPGTLLPLEFAASRTWDALLDTLATLDFTGRRVPFTEATAALVHQVDAANVALPGRASIRILSADEAAAVPHDAVVFAGANEAAWPPAERLHPLLPWRLQAAFGMPGTGKAEARNEGLRQEERLRGAIFHPAAHVLVTYAAESNGEAQRLSPSLVELTDQPRWSTLEPADLLPPSSDSIHPELLADADPLPPLPRPYVHGGANVLKLQAACEFRAFAELRLQSSDLAEPREGLDAREAGTVLHLALQYFWERVGSQEALNALSQERLTAVLQGSIERAFAKVPAHDDGWERSYVGLQKRHLLRLLQQWLWVERARPPFQVEHREEKSTLAVGPLELALRVDRTDRIVTADGRDATLLVDYKSSPGVHAGSWEGERPDEPQLPLYTLLPGLDDVRAVAFAKIVSGKLQWAGLQDEAGLLPRAQVEDVPQQVEEWRRVLTRLAEDFAAGKIAVFPKRYPQTCRLCGQRVLCRLNPATLPERSDWDGPDSLEETQESTLG